MSARTFHDGYGWNCYFGRSFVYAGRVVAPRFQFSAHLSRVRFACVVALWSRGVVAFVKWVKP